MSNDPCVSICIPTYRGARFLSRTIASVLAQTFPSFELWVVDDCSPDATEEVVRAIDDARVRYIRNDRNLGPNGNWNRCLDLARGRYFKLLPHDDLLETDALAEQVAVLDRDVDERLALVFGRRTIIDADDRPIMRRGLRGTPVGIIGAADLVRRTVRAGANIIGEPGNGLVRRSTALRVGPYDAQHPYLVDLDYWFRVLRFGDAWYTGRSTSCFRVSDAQWSVALGRQQFEDWKGFVDRFATDPAFGISSADRQVGFVRARINSRARAILYKLLFARRAKGPSR